jgi:hypothetical protein
MGLSHSSWSAVCPVTPLLLLKAPPPPPAAAAAADNLQFGPAETAVADQPTYTVTALCPVKAPSTYTVSTSLAALRQLQGAWQLLCTNNRLPQTGTPAGQVQKAFGPGCRKLGPGCTKPMAHGARSLWPSWGLMTHQPLSLRRLSQHAFSTSKPPSASPIIPPSSNSTPCCCSGGPNTCRSPRQQQPLLRLRGRPVPVAAPAVAPRRQRSRSGSVLAHCCRLVYIQLTQLQVQGISNVRQPSEAVPGLYAASMACRGAAWLQECVCCCAGAVPVWPVADLWGHQAADRCG